MTMCLGIPLEVVQIEPSGAALCRQGQRLRRIETSLLDEPPAAGDWLLVHIDVAIRTLKPEEARQISDALTALAEAAAGRAYEHLIADLVDREPQLPPHLRPAASPNASGDRNGGSRR